MLDLKLRPSDSHRWMNCQGALQYQKKLGLTNETSSFASEGQEAHRVAEKLLRGEAVDCTDEMRGYVEEYVTYVKNLGGEQMYEVLVHFNEYVPEGSGTCDAIIVKDNVLNIVDLKYGVGVTVSAYKNPQLMLYALGAYLSYGLVWSIEKVNLVVHQPRLDYVSEYSLSVQDLLAFGDEVREKAKLVFSEDIKLVAGEKQCQFCACKPHCKALLNLTKSTLSLNSSDISGLNNEDVKHVIENKGLIINWLNTLESHTIDRLLNREKISGLKLISGRGTRKWYDESSAEFELKHLLGEKSYKKDLISVAQAEKALGKSKKDKISHLVYKGVGKPKVVLDDQRGTPYLNVTSDSFELVVD